VAEFERIACCWLLRHTLFTGGRTLKIMPEARSELNSESNQKILVRTLVHFLRRKNRSYTKSVLITFM
jgi:hypothetical protein